MEIPNPILNHRAHRDFEGTERNPDFHPTMCSLWPLWLILSRFPGESDTLTSILFACVGNSLEVPFPLLSEERARVRRTAGLARGLRRRETDAELKLWRYLRSRQVAGAKFRRQHPVGPYIADFACPQCNLVVELDGSQHGGATDRERDRQLADPGWRVLRFWDNDALKETEAVLKTIFAEVSSPSPQPSPVQGRGNEKGKSRAGSLSPSKRRSG